jgi:hypothetical protein
VIAAPPAGVQAYLDACTPQDRAGLLALRRLVFVQAAAMPQVGPLTEGLRWGQPAFRTPVSGSGCSLRIGTFKGGGFGLFVHCQTGLIDRFRTGPGRGLDLVGRRAVRFAGVEDVAEAPLSILIGWALGYHSC